MQNDSIEFAEVEVLKETEKALLCKIGGEDWWIPKSQLREENEVSGEGDVGKLVISEWLATEKGLL